MKAFMDAGYDYNSETEVAVGQFSATLHLILKEMF